MVNNPARRVALNTAAPIAARGVDAAFAIVYLRLLGRANVGAYTFLVVFTTYLDTLVDFGLNALLAREVSRCNITASEAFRTVNAIRFGLWLAGLPLVVLVYGPLRETANLPAEAVYAGVIFYLALLPSVLAKTSTGILWAVERLDLPAGVSVFSTALRTVLGAVALFGGFGLVGLASASFLTNVATALMLYRLVASQASPRANVGGTPPRWLHDSWPLFVNQLLQGLFFKVDALLLPGLAGEVAAGTYAAAYKVSEGAGVISSSFTLALFPRLSRESNLSHAYELAVRSLLQVAFPLAAGIALLSGPIVALVGGRDYLPDSAVALAILIAYLPLSYANGLTQYVLIAANRQRLLTRAFVAALVFNVVANLVLIPAYGYLGAAIVTVASEIVLLIPFQLVVHRLTPGISLLRELPKPLIATALMAPVVWWLRDAIHPIAAIAAGLAIYPTALWALGGVDADQRRILLQLVR